MLASAMLFAQISCLDFIMYCDCKFADRKGKKITVIFWVILLFCQLSFVKAVIFSSFTLAVTEVYTKGFVLKKIFKSFFNFNLFL